MDDTLMRVRLMVEMTLMMGLASFVLIACLTTELYRLRKLHPKVRAQRIQSVNEAASLTLTSLPPQQGIYARIQPVREVASTTFTNGPTGWKVSYAPPK